MAVGDKADIWGKAEIAFTNMGTLPEFFDVDSEIELAAGLQILEIFHNLEEWEEKLRKYSTPEVNSQLAADNALNRHFPVSGLAYQQLQVAFGSLVSLKLMLLEQEEGKRTLTAGPFGPYALVRNAIDAAAQVLWILEPQRSKLRLKRRILAQLNDAYFNKEFRLEMGYETKKWHAKYKARMLGVATEAGLDVSDFNSWNYPSMTKMLRTLERFNPPSQYSWLAAWQLCSGHAHGKQWAMIESHELNLVTGTVTEIGAEFHVTVSYKILSDVLSEAQMLLRITCEMYTSLAKQKNDS